MATKPRSLARSASESYVKTLLPRCAEVPFLGTSLLAGLAGMLRWKGIHRRMEQGDKPQADPMLIGSMDLLSTQHVYQMLS